MHYFRPVVLADALAILNRHDDVRIAAGCTDLFPATSAPALGGSVIDVTAIESLRGISRTGDHWRIGATATWSDVGRADLPPAFDAPKLAAREVGSIQIQNAATIAGNLCNASPAADGVPALLILDAQVELTAEGSQRTLPLDQFITGVRQTARAPNELVTAILIPDSATAGRSSFLKLGARRYLVISIAMVAARLDIDAGEVASAAVAVGACSPVAKRLARLEEWLHGKPPAEAPLFPDELVRGELSPIDDIRGDAAYRLEAAVLLVRRALGALCGQAASEAA